MPLSKADIDELVEGLEPSRVWPGAVKLDSKPGGWIEDADELKRQLCISAGLTAEGVPHVPPRPRPGPLSQKEGEAPMSTDARTWPDTPEAWKAALLDAERELSNMAYEYNMLSSQSAREINTLRTERDALQSDLKALLPLARVLLNYHDNRAKGEYARLDGADESFFAAARAILDRETP